MSLPEHPFEHRLVTLASDALHLAVSPDIGGSIARLRYGAAEVLRPMSKEALSAGQVREAASYPLVPFSNRIAQARFSVDGKPYVLRRNFGDHPHAIHGCGWQSPWRIVERDHASLRLALDHRPLGAGDWPFPFAAEQRFALAGTTLTLALSITNRADCRMPTGLGWHPFFPADPGTTLRARAGHVWLNGQDHLPSERVAVPEAWDCTNPRAVSSMEVDNCFADWDGQAEITSPTGGWRARMRAGAGLTHLVVYVPKGKGFFAVEPVSHMNDAINRMDGTVAHGLKMLEPDETFRVATTITLEPV